MGATLRGAVRQRRSRGETNPRSVYERLFRAAGPAGDSAKQDTLLLDRVLGHSKRMRATVSAAADQARVDEYLSIVRSLETRIKRAATRSETRGSRSYRLIPCHARPIIPPRMKNTCA